MGGHFQVSKKTFKYVYSYLCEIAFCKTTKKLTKFVIEFIKLIFNDREIQYTYL